MENRKSPGIDGIPIEFYKTFCEFLKNNLIQLYNMNRDNKSAS